ncbi:MAG: cytochrome c3 family protein [Acidobacteriota bacterium]
MAKKRKASKGTFSDIPLSVAKKYLYPTQRRVLWWGALAALALGLYSAIDFRWRDARFLSNGPLSSAHAVLEQDCASCHTPFGKVEDQACSDCHEKVGDELGVFSFASHYLYRSNDFQRLATSDDEQPCAACHTEHLGREAEITRVDDGQCLPCHAVGSFNAEHPQFEFAAKEIPDDDALAFTHIHHTREVMERENLVDVERACLYCHNPRPDGRSFQPIDFDRHCDACHLNASITTTRLPIEADGAPGVTTLATFIERQDPGTSWALFANPAEFRQVGSRVSKSPVHHADPWIMENLRRLRRALYSDAGLADLLQVSADIPASELTTLYEEAIATLEDYAIGLRSRPEPEIQTELEAIERMLKQVRRSLEDPYTPLDETELLLALDERPRSDLGDEQVTEIEDLVDQLTQTCQPCHAIDRATIARVQKDQRILRRAEFDHQAHTLQVRCLECHAEIPIAEGLEGETQPAETAFDRAAIQNLPRIEQCQQCHQPELSTNNCVTCHEFHPDKGRRSDLLLYLSDEEQAAQTASAEPAAEATAEPAAEATAEPGAETTGGAAGTDSRGSAR